MAALYSVWRLARVLPLAQPAGAINRARQIDRLQHVLHMPTELSLQHFVLQHSWLARQRQHLLRGCSRTRADRFSRVALRPPS